MKRLLADAALRRGLLDGLIVSAMFAVLVVLTNVVFPGGPEESDADPEYLWQYLVVLTVLAALLFAIGVRARGHTGARDPLAGAKAGGAAGVVIAVMLTIIFLVVNNLFFDVVSQQYDKRVAFAASGWTSMRAYLTVTQIAGMVILVPALTGIGALLGLLGATLWRPRAAV